MSTAAAAYDYVPAAFGLYEMAVGKWISYT